MFRHIILMLLMFFLLLGLPQDTPQEFGCRGHENGGILGGLFGVVKF